MTSGGSAQRLTFRHGLASWPAFEPDGQRLAYVCYPIVGGAVQDRWELRRVDLSGANDVPLLAPGNDLTELKSVRWSPDGAWIYFTRNDSLLALSSTTGAVVAHPEIMTKVASFDFHLSGTNRLAAEQSGVAGSITNPQYVPPVAFRRLVLRDVAATDTRARFYRTGAEFYHPRWSPNGIRIAYGANQNTVNTHPTDRDLFLGQVSYDQPPSFQGLGDVAVYPGQAFQMTLTATDPNGEALSYDMPATYLPAGSSFNSNPGSRVFSWPSPGPQAANYYVVARAFDGSGGVANQVVRLAVTLAAVGDLNSDVIADNQAWLAWTAPGQGTAQGVEYDLRFAPFALNEANFYVGVRWASVPTPGIPGAYQDVTVGGLSPCTQYWFAIRTKDTNGNWSPISNVFSATTLCGGGGGGFSAQERAANPASRRVGDQGGSVPALVVEMELEAGAPVWTLTQLSAEDAAALGVSDSVSVMFQTSDGSGKWLDRRTISVADASWRFAIRALRKPGRILFLGPYGARQAWSTVGIDRTDAVASLASATHSRLGSLEGTFAKEGSTSLDVVVGDTLVLAYKAVAADGASALDWFLLVGPTGSDVATPTFTFAHPQAHESAPPLPTVIALRQNQPNPFSLTTQIRFDLPAETVVRLEVFDLQGRRVATLADGLTPAGFRTVSWDRRDASGTRVKPGVYLYRFEAGSFRDQKKMLILQ